jgi:hypothetical protein
MDLELKEQLEQCEPFFQGNDFIKFLKAQRRFNKQPVHVVKEFREEGELVYNFHLRHVLNNLPAYMKSSKKSGLTYEQGQDLLLHLFNGDRYDFTDKESDLLILTKSLSVSQGDKTLPTNLDKVKKLMSSGVDSSGMGGSIYSFYLTSRLGIPVANASPMIVKAIENSYVAGPFNEALKSMLPAKPNPELAVEAFNMMNNDGMNHWTGADYKTFKHLMTFCLPASGLSIDSILAMFVSASKSQSKRKMLEGVIEKRPTLPNKEKYFLPFEGRLEHFAQPYVTKRSLDEGLEDLARLATLSYNNWDEVGEGSFVFDPKSELWYSLGGELELPSMEEVLSGRAERVRHNFLPYDISDLSETPFLFHVHPEELDTFVKPREEDLTYPHLREHITKFTMATPSRADYRVVAQLMKNAKSEIKPRSFIFHKLGTTEFVYPYNIQAIEEMGEKARILRDQPLLNPPEHSLHLDESQFVKVLIDDLNTKLPKGFALNLHLK